MAELKKLNLDTTPLKKVAASSSAVTSSASEVASNLKETTTQTISSAKETTTTAVKDLTHPHKRPVILLLGLAILLGLGTGFVLNRQLPGAPARGSVAKDIDTSTVKVGDIIGIEDEKAFPDEAEGYLEKGGLDGEGSHKLLRPGGLDQTVYLTSSVVDLDALVGHKVHVWGETFAAQKAGWLMDVGRVRVVELDADKPF